MRKVWLSLGVAAAVLALSTAVRAEHKPQKLTKAHMDMMKNGAMKHMDTFMSSPAAMKKLGPRMMQAQKEALKYGEELFNSKTALSTNGQACASCHPGGGTIGGTVQTPMKSELTGKPYDLPVADLHGAAATFPKYKVPNDAVINLADMNNNCIMMFMMAQPLDPKSKEARALAAYVTSLSNEAKVEVGKVPDMMKKMMMKMGGGMKK